PHSSTPPPAPTAPTRSLPSISLTRFSCLRPPDSERGDVSDSAKSSVPLPVYLPVDYELLDAEYFLLKEAGQDFMRNSSMGTHTQPFVVLRASGQPVVNASYGPLSAQQPVPRDLLQGVPLFNAPGALTYNWKIQSFVLTPRVFSSKPKVRVLFYVAGREWGGRPAEAMEELPCVTVYAFWQTQEVRGSCTLGGEKGTCMAELVPLPSWFAAAGGESSSSSSERQDPSSGNPVELYYQAWPSAGGSCSSPEVGRRGGPGGQQRQARVLPVTPMQRIGSLRLLQVPKGMATLSRLKLGNAIVIRTASKPLKKTDIATFYILMVSSAQLLNFTLRATVKKGVTFRTATPTNTLLWDMTLDTGTDGTINVVCQRTAPIPGKSSLLEVLQMDFEVEELSSPLDSQVIIWKLELPQRSQDQGAKTEGAMRIYTTQRDFVGLAPLVMDTEILNTAMLTGKKVVMPVRTVAVEEDGVITDVSDFTDCSSTDEDVLKVSDRCDYVFVNGKEMRGKVGMLVNFSYSFLSAQLELNVWIPRLPLQMEVSDTELSQIKSWRVPIVTSKRPGWSSEEEDRKGKGCMLQFQHALVRVLTHFTAEQEDPRDPKAYFLGSDWQVDVTQLVRYFLKVEDPRVARLQAGRVLSGRDLGTTSVQVISPLTDAILAKQTITVVDDKVSLTELGVQMVAGLSMALQLSQGSNRAILATTTSQELLQSPKQEALVSTWLQFSDGSQTPLDIYDAASYLLTVSSLNAGVASVQGSPPVVVAEGEGQGLLVKVEMSICEACQKSKRKSIIALGKGSLRVKFQAGDGGGDGGEDGGSDYGSDGEELNSDWKRQPPSQDSPTAGNTVSGRKERAKQKVTTVRPAERTIITSGSLGGVGKTSGPKSPGGPGAPGNLVNYNSFTLQAGAPGQGPGVEIGGEEVLVNRPLTDLEIGMYALLGVFCLAILVFLGNCVSYVVKFRHKKPPSHGPEPTGHRHDWVWLGTDAELVMSVPGSPLQQDNHTATTVMDIGPDKTASLSRRPSCLASLTDSPPPGCGGPMRSKHLGGDSLHSPTSKRKRVQFTTFSTLERQHSPQQNGHQGIHWVGKESSHDKQHPQGPTSRMHLEEMRL
uniref:Transmembrane protein 132D n=1 Tax=Gadus morhua TaxID=8049 RepID=A0A8C4Z695_GADMO